MPRLDARWDNFWERGQVWYGFDADGGETFATVIGSSTVDAVILRPGQAGSFAVSAIFLRPASGATSAAATILAHGSGSFATDATILRTQSGTSGADATVIASRAGSFAVAAWIQKTQLGSLSAAATLLATRTAGPKADAVLRSTVTPAGLGAAAWVGGSWLTVSTEAYLDTFTRDATTAPPFSVGSPDLGPAWHWIDYDSETGFESLSPLHVNGSALALPPYTYDSLYGPPSIDIGEVWFDVWVPAAGDSQQDIRWIDTNWWAGIGDSGDDTNYQFLGTSTLWPITRSAWARVHLKVDRAASGEYVKGRIWAVGSAEPETWVTIRSTWPVQPAAQWRAYTPILDIYYSSSGEDTQIDNVRVRKNPLYVDAKIGDPPKYGSFGVAAWLQRTVNRYLFEDDFNRSVSPGLGNGWAHSNGSLNVAYADGTKALWPAQSWEGFRQDTIIPGPLFDLYADIWIPAAANISTSWWLYYYFAAGRLSFEVKTGTPAPTGTPFNVTLALVNVTGVSFSVDESSWYKIHVQQGSTNTYAWIWKSGTDEPSTPTLTSTFYSGNSAPQISVIGPQAEAAAIDNYRLDSGIHVNAWITIPVTTVTGTFPVEAAILGTVTPAGFGAAAWTRGAGLGDFPVDAVVSVTQGSRTWFALDAVIAPAGQGGFPIEYRVYDPSRPDLYPPTSWNVAPRRVPVNVVIGGTDVTGHIVWATARFTAKVNGAVGDCSFQVRDDAHELEFTFGQEIKLLIDGVVRWGGWVLRPQRTFAMSVQPEPVTSPRIWQIEGVDYNAIFDKRILHDLSNPERAWNYMPGSYDDTIIRDIWKYFDMGGFTLDVERVGVAILDIPGVTAKGKKGGLLASGGFTLRDVMTSIIRNTAAIFYCSPTKVITYLDSDKVNSPYTLTDQPYAAPNVLTPYAVGYREAKIRQDNTEMCNDAIVWGAGYGGDKVVYSRHQDATSRADHGRWQKGNFISGVYKQATVNALALSYVEGSPAAHRAQKFPKRSVELVTDSSAFNAGDVVNVVSTQFAYTDVLPIRQAQITFPTPYLPRYQLQMSWEIDADWTMFDPWVTPRDDGPGTDHPPADDKKKVGPCYRYITDTFTRTENPGWGINESGVGYTSIEAANKHSEVDGSRGWLGIIAESPYPYPAFEVHNNIAYMWLLDYPEYVTLPFPVDTSVDIEFDGTQWGYNDNTGLDDAPNALAIYINMGSDPTHDQHARVQIWPATGAISLEHSGVWNDLTFGAITVNTRIRIRVDEYHLWYKAWSVGSDEPDDWDASVTGASALTTSDQSSFYLQYNQQRKGQENYLASGCYFDNLVVTYVDPDCDVETPVYTSTGIGHRACEELVPQGTPVSGSYPSGTEWVTTSASYTPSSTRLAFDGSFQFGNYEETDPIHGLITINTTVDEATVVTLCYLTDGPLPYDDGVMP